MQTVATPGAGEAARAAAVAGPRDAATVLARRLYALGDHPVRTLEAVAEAETNRLRHDRQSLAAADAPVPDDALYRACRRMANRALAARESKLVDGATRYHEAWESPAWARSRRPVAQVGEVLFYAEAGNAEQGV